MATNKSNQRTLLAISTVALMCFLSILYARPYFAGINSSVNIWFFSIQTQTLTETAKTLAYCFDTTILLGITLPIVGLLLYKGYIRKACLLIGAMGADALLLEICKTFVLSHRPLNSLMVEQDYSFPSGHVTSTIVFLGMLSYLAWQKKGSITKICLASVTTAMAVIVGFDRLYLNAHWFSDVMAAPFLALFVLATSILVIQYMARWYVNRQRRNAPVAKASLDVRDATLYGRAITSTAQTTMRMK